MRIIKYMENGQLPKGVSYDPKRRIKKFKAVMKIGGKTKHLGYYRSAEEAHEAFKKAKEQIVSDG